MQRRISILLDDLQWSDLASLNLIESFVLSNGGNKNDRIFFTLCYRDDEVSGNEQFKEWLSSISLFSLETIKVENMDVVGVNSLVSETLHLGPRITRPLASALHHKTRGACFNFDCPLTDMPSSFCSMTILYHAISTIS